MKGKTGLAGRYYTLTPKAEEFIDHFENWCAERRIKKEEIQKFLLYLVDADNDVEWERISWNEARKELIERGYIKLRDRDTIIPEPMMKLDPE